MRYIRPLKDIPGVEEVPSIHASDSKETRGFNHHASARLLCPRHLRDKFDADRKAFCRDVQNGKRIIDHDDWPSFLYPETGYNSEAIDEGLLRGPFLVSVSHSVICICIANLYLVLPTPVHWSAHCHEGNRWQGSGPEVYR